MLFGGKRLDEEKVSCGRGGEGVDARAMGFGEVKMVGGGGGLGLNARATGFGVKTVGWRGGVGVVERMTDAMWDCTVGGGVGVLARRAGWTAF